jgi:predicted RNA binding protein YcfA (HicA-like mRNA interferase family)
VGKQGESMETNSRKLLRLLQNSGWEVVRISGDHHIMTHPGFDHSIVLPHPKKDLSTGLVRRIYKEAGWR